MHRLLNEITLAALQTNTNQVMAIKKGLTVNISRSNNITNEKYITTREAAHLLGVTVRTVQNWVDSGKLSAKLTLGGHRRLRDSEVDALVAELNGRDTQSVTTNHLENLGEDNSNHSKLRILAVEDKSELLNFYKLRFSTFSLPHELFTAEDGVQGIFKVGRHTPHVLLMDLHMPNMDGFQMLRSLQNIDELGNMKIVVATGLSAAEIADKGGLPSGVLLLPKPLPFETFQTICMQYATELGLPTKLVNKAI